MSSTRMAAANPTFAREKSSDSANSRDRRLWPYRSPRFRALRHDFEIVAENRAIGLHIQHLFRGLQTETGVASSTYALEDLSAEANTLYRLTWNRQQVVRTRFVGRLLSMLQWHVNQRVIETSDDLVLMHAGGVERDGIGVALPAPMESGKTTLVAGLILRHGFRYLTDEAVAIDPARLVAHPYHKPFTIDSGSFTVLAELEPTAKWTIDSEMQPQWHIPATSIQADSLAASVPLRVVVTPRYMPNRPTRLEPLSKAQTLTTLIESTFRWSADTRHKFDVLARVANQVRGYRLWVQNLEEACRIMDDLVHQETGVQKQ
jgi:hypothetical protein